jgi:hypothetical protein
LDDDLGIVEQVTIAAKYGGYIDRQAQQVDRFRRLEDKPLPPDLDYSTILQLRAEAREKFLRVRPRSLGQAGRISGINPSDVATLLVHLKLQNPSGLGGFTQQNAPSHPPKDAPVSLVNPVLPEVATRPDGTDVFGDGF